MSIVNEKGERRETTLDLNGVVRRIASFDGRVERFKVDPMERLIEHIDADGRRTRYERNSLGQIVAVTYADGSSASFSFDARGQLTSAKNGAVQLDYELASTGKPLRERQTVAGAPIEMEFGYDVMRRRVRASATSGYDVAIDRDSAGRWNSVSVGGDVVTSHEYDPVGREVRRHLAGGATLETGFTPIGDVAMRRLVGPAGSRSHQEPEELGPLARVKAVIEKRFIYQANTWLASRYDNRQGSVEYGYDLQGRVLSATRSGNAATKFAYDACGNVLPQGELRSYGLGNRLLRAGDVDYKSDAQGRIVEKVRTLSDGARERTTYEWDGAGNLKRVLLPDGQRVDFDYDPFARRFRKRVFARNPRNGTYRVIRDVRYVWNGAQIAQEIVRQPSRGTDAVMAERIYLYDPDGAPMAHVHIEDKSRVTRYYVTDHAGTPEQVVDQRGSLVGELTRDVWGVTHQKVIEVATREATTTPHRFRGQWEDEETGLCYNRYRYYDPSTGRYLSPDPAARLPDANEFRYGTSPINDVDPLGLTHQAQATWYPDPARNEPPRQLGTNGNLESGFDAPNARSDMMNPSVTTNADDYSARSGRRQTNAAVTANGPQNESVAQSRARGEVMAQNRERFGDTEAQAIREVERAVPNQADRANGRLEIQGQLPPCQMCRSRMQEFARRNNCTVEYRYPLGANPTGLFRSDRGNSTWTQNGQRVEAVAGASHSSYPTPRVPPGQPRPPGYREIADADANLPVPRPNAAQ
jgi:RHS repeat-associated protein